MIDISSWAGWLIAGIILIVIGIVLNRHGPYEFLKTIGHALYIVGIILVIVGIVLLVFFLVA